MATPIKWSGVSITMESALGADKSISAITKANPGVCTSTSHGLTNGTYVLLSIVGMWQLDQRLMRIANVATNTFELEGEDTSLYDTFVSGKANAETFGNSIASVTEISSSGGDPEFIDTTTVNTNVRTQVPGAAQPATYTMTNIWDPTDAGLLAMNAAYNNQAAKGFKFVYGTGGKIMLFYGFPAASLLPAGSAQGLVTTQTAITVYGKPKYYAS
jgi:hypothetical protein